MLDISPIEFTRRLSGSLCSALDHTEKACKSSQRFPFASTSASGLFLKPFCRALAYTAAICFRSVCPSVGILLDQPRNTLGTSTHDAHFRPVKRDTVCIAAAQLSSVGFPLSNLVRTARMS